MYDSLQISMSRLKGRDFNRPMCKARWSDFNLFRASLARFTSFKDLRWVFLSVILIRFRLLNRQWSIAFTNDHSGICVARLHLFSFIPSA